MGYDAGGRSRIRPHQCDSEGGRIRGVLLYFKLSKSKGESNLCRCSHICSDVMRRVFARINQSKFMFIVHSLSITHLAPF